MQTVAYTFKLGIGAQMPWRCLPRTPGAPRRLAHRPRLLCGRVPSNSWPPFILDAVPVGVRRFGSGHSAALFLEASPLVDVVTFDRFDRPYQLPIASRLRRRHPGRYTVVRGDSCETVPAFRGRCDFLHGSSLCPTDNLDLVGKAGCGVQLTSTAMQTVRHPRVYFGGPQAQWSVLRAAGCVRDIRCYDEAPLTPGVDSRTPQLFHGGHASASAAGAGGVGRPGTRVDTGAGAVPQAFCVAVTTGKCSGRTASAISVAAAEGTVPGSDSDREASCAGRPAVPPPPARCDVHRTAVPPPL